MNISKVNPTRVTFSTLTLVENEKEFEAIIRSYMEGSRAFGAGGVVNLATTIAQQLDAMADEYDCRDYATAAEFFRSLEDKVDLQYEHNQGE